MAGPETTRQLDAYWKCDDMDNESEIKGKEKYTRLVGFEFGMSSAVDLASGRASGRRQHRPLVIKKLLDKSTPLLIHALVGNKTLAKSELIVMAVTLKDGKKVDKFKLSLENVRVIDVETIAGGEDEAAGEIVDTVKLTYDKITYEDLLAKKMATDDWREV